MSSKTDRQGSGATRLAVAIRDLPGEALVPVHWIRERLEDPEYEVDGLKVDLTVEEAAEAFGRSPSTIREWCKAGAIEGTYKLQQREWRIPRNSLEAFQAKQRTQPPMAKQRFKKGKEADLDAWRKEIDKRGGSAA
jgi:excisionase family DNA binding protein